MASIFDPAGDPELRKGSDPSDPLGAPRDPDTEEPSEDPLDPELPADPDISSGD